MRSLCYLTFSFVIAAESATTVPRKTSNSGERYLYRTSPDFVREAPETPDRDVPANRRRASSNFHVINGLNGLPENGPRVGKLLLYTGMREVRTGADGRL